MAFSQKLLSATFALAQGTFGDTGSNTFTASGVRTTCHIDAMGGAKNSNMELAVYGLPLSVMNQLTTYGTNFNEQGKNGVSVSAGDASGLSLVFQGNIFFAWVDAQSQPQVALRVVAQPGAFFNVANQAPISFRGATPAATIAEKIAGLLGATFENNGVTTVLTNPYYYSDAITMIRRLSEDAGFEWILDKGTLAIVPPGQSRQSAAVAISPQTIMDGYPQWVSNLLVVKCLFSPEFTMLGNVSVQSSLTPAAGMWRISKIEHDLEARMPHGKWFSTLSCVPVKFMTPAT
jgi:hypothetical protein